MTERKQLISSDQAKRARCQHTTPCSDCPWRRTSLRGWLGSMSPGQWVATAHSESTIECHTKLGVQCAGSAVYRANVAKVCRDPSVLKLPPNREIVFSSPMEFMAHHEQLGIK